MTNEDGVASRPPRSPYARTVKRRQFTAEQDALLRAVHDGRMTQYALVKQLRISAETLRARAAELGLPPLLPGERAAQSNARPADCPPGWFPIAHGADGRWREFEGTPLTIVAAQSLVAAGRAHMAQRRIDGGFDLLVKVLP
ncbi:MAG: hypothetical protein ACOVNS_03740 [Erythrobacter sp.]|jgi:hypothetical protein